jgi:hypothetical protein
MRVMRYLPALMLALLTVTAGCSLFGGKRNPQTYDAQRPPIRGTSASTEVVYLDVAVLERPSGDRYLDHEVWESGDEQGVELELKPLLENNGLRVCTFCLLPDRLQALLSSPRFCPSPRRYRTEPDKATALQVGPVRDACSFTVRPGGNSKTLSFEQARCEFDVLPISEDEGRVRLRFTPRVRHGRPRRETRVARDPDGQLRWAMESAEPTEEFAELRFELSVGSGEYVAVGTWQDKEGTWGHGCFVPAGSKLQYLLVMRATRAPQGDEPAGPIAPLALQANWTAARGSSR